METIGVECETYNKRVSFDDCIKCGECFGNSPLHVKSIIDGHLDNKSYPVFDRVFFRASSLFECKKAWLFDKILEPKVYMPLLTMYIMLRGKVMHELIQRAYTWKETEFGVDFYYQGEPYRVQGTPDCLDPPRKSIHEIKSTRFFPSSSNMRVLSAFRPHILQLSSYYSMGIEMGLGEIIDNGKITYLGFSDYEVYEIDELDYVLKDIEDWTSVVVKYYYKNKDRLEKDKEASLLMPAKDKGVKCKKCMFAEYCI